MSAIQFNATGTNASGKTTTAPREVSSANPLPVTVVSGGGGGEGAVTLADGADVTQGSQGDSAYGGSGGASVVSLLKGLYAKLLAAAAYVSPNGKAITTHTTLDSLLSDDFGGTAVNTSTTWDVINGGLPAIVSGAAVSVMAAAPVPAFSQARIGSGITGMTDSVSASTLTVTMGTTLGAERWYLSQKVFAGKEDIFIILSRSQALAQNDLFIGLVEVDPVTFIPLLNPNIAADGNGAGEFTNRGGVQVLATATAGLFTAQAIGDSSSGIASGNAGTSITGMNTAQEYLIEIDSRDIIVSNANADSVSAKAATASRVSTQCPNDTRLYKLLLRFRNTGTPGSSTTVAVNRILVVDNYEQRVQISTAEGDQIGSKALGVNVVNTPGVNANVTGGNLALSPNAGIGPTAMHKLTSAATTNATSVKTSNANLCAGSLRNRAASERYFKFYNKASAPTVGTDIPVLTIGLPPASSMMLADFTGAAGIRFGNGIAYAITGAYADSDTTAVAAGDVDVNLVYN
ncbi:MAG TPA: hypothetical protein VHC39_16370 [Rhizomicrobium sp.]|nr:hypothetical protein [Rhizomicrobium sp.]